MAGEDRRRSTRKAEKTLSMAMAFGGECERNSRFDLKMKEEHYLTVLQ